MFVVLLENANNTVLSKMEIFVNKYPKSSIKYIDKYTTSDELRSLKFKPLLSIGWLIIFRDISVKFSYIKFLKRLDNTNLILFRVTSEQKCKELLSILKSDNIDYKFINNYKLKQEDVIGYIFQNLNISKDDAKYLYSRVHGYLPEVVNSVQTLKVLDKITKPLIRKYIAENRNIAVYDMVNYMLGLNTVVTYEDCVQLVYSYRYGFEHLLKSLIAQIHSYNIVFGKVLSGELTLSNYKSKKSEIDDKEISQLHDYRLYKIIESFDNVSYDYLQLLEIRLRQISSNFYAGVYDLISILKWSKVSTRVSNNLETQMKSQMKEDIKETENKLKRYQDAHYSVDLDNLDIFDKLIDELK